MLPGPDVVGGVVVVVVAVVLVVTEVVSAGRSSTFAHAASARARENATDGRMTFISEFPVWACLCAVTSEPGMSSAGLNCKHRTRVPGILPALLSVRGRGL